ncbi:MAG: thiamine diphosphokinase [Candidatus Kryptoniota bacterium]
MNFENFVLVICNGEAPSAQRIRSLISHPKFIACADGGANKAFALNYKPDLIIGDLDSLSMENGGFGEAEIVKIASQDNTDFEKTLDVLIDRGFDEFLVAAFSGGRIDQTIANLQIAYSYLHRCKIILADDKYLIFPADKTFSLIVSIGTEVSIIPMEDNTRISTEGLEYALHDDYLRKGGQGISNRAIADKITITIDSGGLLAFVRDA